MVLENIYKSRSAEVGVVEILSNITLSLSEGELSVFVGPSGGGKSTLLRLLNRLEDPTSGRILLRGKDLQTLEPVELRRDVAMVLQKPFMFEGSVLENLQKPFALRKEPLPDADSSLVKQVLERCSLDQALLTRRAQSLSVGQQQRVSLARCLITGPQILLLDEPTSALDRPTGDALAGTLRTICRTSGITVIMVTHDLRLAGQIADRLIYLEGGQVLEQGSADDLLNRPKSPQLKKFLEEPHFQMSQTEEEASHDRSQPA